MKKRIKLLILVGIILIILVGVINAIAKAKERKEEEVAFEKDKIVKDEAYQIKRENNKYTIKGEKLIDKELKGIEYDDTNVYLYYDNDKVATLLKYNIEEQKIVVLYEDNEKIHGGITKIGSYYQLGNEIVDNKFKKVMDELVLEENEFLFPNLKQTLRKTDTGVEIKTIETEEEKEVISNTESVTYAPYAIQNNGKYMLLLKTTEEKEEMVVADQKGKIINSFDQAQEKSYQLLDDVPYLLEKNQKDQETSYRIYDTKTKEIIYQTNSNSTNHLFDDTKLICTDKDGNIRLMDYVTKEEKVLLENVQEKLIPATFHLASDKYSLVMTLENKKNQFFIFYL